VSLGSYSDATTDYSTAVGYAGQATGTAATALGGETLALAPFATAVGYSAEAKTGSWASALGYNSNADGAASTAIGSQAQATAIGSSATGYNAVASGDYATVLGYGSNAAGATALALGAAAKASQTGSVAIGGDAGVLDADSDGAQATGAYALALGADAKSSGTLSFAIGPTSSASATQAMALGTGAKATANFSYAIGLSAQANAVNSLALGAFALANATHDRSTAIGYQASTTRADQVMIGTVNRTYTLPGLPTAASNAAQSGSKFYVTVDAQGNLGYITTPISGASSSITAEPLRTASLSVSAEAAPISAVLGTQAATVEQPAEAAPSIASNTGQTTAGDTISAIPSRAVLAALTPSAVADADFSALSGRVGAIEGRVAAIEGQLSRFDKRIASSTAVAVAMGGAAFLPDMKFNLTANVGTYDGAHAGALQLGALVSPHVALNAGVATGFNKQGSTAGRVGVTFGW